MRLTELMKRLDQLKKKEYIRSLRKGPTGVGHLLENELGLSETNVAIPDIGARLELKATRKNANSLITLFTFNRAVWKIRQKEIIEKYGYIDNKRRKALYSTVSNTTPNAQGFYLIPDSQKHVVSLKNVKEDSDIAEWSTYVLAGKFMTKLDRLLLIFADNKYDGQYEMFWFNEAYLLEKPTPEQFLKAFEINEFFIDIRMYLRASGGVRNHGTAFRISEKNLLDLYAQKRKLL